MKTKVKSIITKVFTSLIMFAMFAGGILKLMGIPVLTELYKNIDCGHTGIYLVRWSFYLLPSFYGKQPCAWDFFFLMDTSAEQCP
jgi:hypothetical protein